MADDTALPTTITAGTTVAYTRTLEGYAANDGWAMQLLIAGAKVLAKDAVASGAAFDVTLSATETALLEPGLYRWVERVTKAGAVHDAASGNLVVEANLGDATPGSLQSWEEKTLAVVESALAGQLGDGIASYQIAGRAVSKIPVAELVALRNSLRAQVRTARTGRASRPVLFRFTGTEYDR